MTITPEEVAKLHLKAMQGDIVPILYRVSDMADLIARMDEALKAADELMSAGDATATRLGHVVGREAVVKHWDAIVLSYRAAREKLK